MADGFFHEFSGWVIYIAAFIMLFGVGWILDRFKPASLSRKKDSKVSEEEASRDKLGAGSTQVISAEGTE